MAIWDYVPGGNMIESFLHPEKGYEEAQKKWEQAWREAQGYGRPYWEKGLGESGFEALAGAENALLNPGDLLNKWMQDYKMSDFAKNLLRSSKEAGLSAASSQGLLGSNASTQNIEQSAGEITAADLQQYLQDLIQQYLAGVGIAGNIYNQGAGMGRSLLEGAQNYGKGEAELAYGRQNAPGNLLEHIIQMGANAAKSFGGGGFGAGAGMGIAA